jgi:hypothetical protein
MVQVPYCCFWKECGTLRKKWSPNDVTQCSPIELLKQDAANENFNRRWVFDEVFKLSTAD